MDMQDEARHPAPGVQEAAAAWEAPRVLRSNPPAVQPDLNSLIEKNRRRFPKTLARLAE